MLVAERQACWQFPDPIDEEYGAHYRSVDEAERDRAEAIDMARDDLDDDPESADPLKRLMALELARIERPCLTVRCNNCETTLVDGEWERVIHFHGEREAEETAREYDWTTDGVRHHCRTCPVLLDEGDLRDPVEGQLALIENGPR